VSYQTPEISIVVIAYNEEAKIADCLTALRSQNTKHSYEVIVVDDGSLDQTAAITTRAAATDPRIRLIRHPKNLGRGAARATGFAAVTAPITGFVDADIIIPSNWIERIYQAMQSNNAVSAIAVPDGDCAVIWRIFKPTARVVHGTASITGNNLMIETKLLRSTGFDPSSKLGEDFRLAAKLTAAGYKLTTLDDLTVQHLEAKSYYKSLRWLFSSGVDASRLLLEFGRFRSPDLAWLLWSASLLVATDFLIYGKFLTALLIPLAVTSAVTLGHAYTRFNPLPNPLRWSLAALADIPLITAYLTGRLLGFLSLLLESKTLPTYRLE